MMNAIQQLDRLLRGDATRLEALRERKLDVSVRGIAAVGAILGVIYGLCMGVFSLTGSGSHAPMQIVASAVKVPLLFFMTLLVTFPSLYVFNALMGSRLGLVLLLRLLVGAIGVMMAILASLGPIVAFFSLTTTSYPFMTLLNVVMFALAGFLGGAFLLRTLQRLTLAAEMAMQGAPGESGAVAGSVPESQESQWPAGEAGAEEEKAAARARVIAPPPVVAALRADRSPIGRQGARSNVEVGVLFKIWVVVFGLVGGQMAWIMRPFIGDPNTPFEWFRPTRSNFFEAVLHSIQRLL